MSKYHRVKRDEYGNVTPKHYDISATSKDRYRTLCGITSGNVYSTNRPDRVTCKRCKAMLKK